MLNPDDILRLVLLAEAKSQLALDKAEDLVRLCKENVDRLAEIRAASVEVVYARRKGPQFPIDRGPGER